MAKQHTVAAGECLSAIAAKYGFPDYHAIYGDPANASFREERPNPNLIYAGDVIAIPDKKKGTKSARSGATHKFVARVGTKQLLLKLESEPGEPLANVIFEIQAPGLQTIRGGTDEEGFLDVRVPAKLKQATVKAADLSWDIAIGDLNPIHKAKDDGISGSIRARSTASGATSCARPSAPSSTRTISRSAASAARRPSRS